MGLALPVFSRSCCCCCGEGGGDEFTDENGLFLGILPAAPPPEGSTVAPPSDPLAWRRNPLAGVRSRVPYKLYKALSAYQTDPVRVLSLCGADRDCVPDERIMGSFAEAERGAKVWIRKGNGRSVKIFAHPAGFLMAEFKGSSTKWVEFVPNQQQENEMRAIQNSPNGGRYGFLRD